MMKRILMCLLLPLAMMSTSLPASAQTWDGREDTTIYLAVYNHEWQYSIWPADRELPLGWKSTGFQGMKVDVLAFIERVWTDMRPLSLRRKMLEALGGSDRCVAADLPPHQCQP